MYLTTGKTYYFRTWADSGDTVMHLWYQSGSSGQEKAYNDDYSGMGWNSRFAFTPLIDGYYKLVVRAYSMYGWGTTKVMQCDRSASDPWDKCEERCADLPIGCPTKTPDPLYPASWTTLAYTAPFKGTWISSPASHLSAPGYEYQTAEVNAAAGGTNDTVLLALDSANRLAAFDDDSGVGTMDRISASTGEPWRLYNLVVGAYATEGKTHVYTNDRPIRDEDGDGLGKYLEFYLGSCDTANTGDPWSKPYCQSRHLARLRDSDRDGLLDAEELFGIDQGGSGRLGETNCHTFESWPIRAVPLTTTENIAGVSALEWDGQIVLAYTTTDGKAWVRRTSTITLDDLGWQPGSGTPIASDLQLDTEIDLSYMYVTPSLHPEYPQQSLLAMFLVEAGDPLGRHVWYWATAADGTWTRKEVRDDGGTWLQARRVAGVATWPNRLPGGPDPADFGAACGVFGKPRIDPDHGEVRDDAYFYCYDRDADSWTEDIRLPGNPKLAGRKPSVAFHTLREGGQSVAEPLGGDRTVGQFWIAVVPSDEPGGAVGKQHPMFYVTRQISASAPPTPGPAPLAGGSYNGHRWLDFAWDQWGRTLKSTGFVLRETGELSALKAALHVRLPVPNTEKDEADYLTFLPFADGTFHAALTDINDFRVMERGICLGLHGLGMSDEGLACGLKNGDGY